MPISWHHIYYIDVRVRSISLDPLARWPVLSWVLSSECCRTGRIIAIFESSRKKARMAHFLDNAGVGASVDWVGRVWLVGPLRVPSYFQRKYCLVQAWNCKHCPKPKERKYASHRYSSIRIDISVIYWLESSPWKRPNFLQVCRVHRGWQASYNRRHPVRSTQFRCRVVKTWGILCLLFGSHFWDVRYGPILVCLSDHSPSTQYRTNIR